MTLSILVPVFNEENTIKEIIAKVISAKVPQGMIRDIILVDDGSTDKSWKIIKKIKGKKNVNIETYRHKKNEGKGAAIRTALAHAQGDLILIQDADLEYDPDQYMSLLKPMKKKHVQVVYGTRLKSYPVKFIGPNKTPLFTHYLGNKLLTEVTNFLFDSSITDMETCYKLFRKSVVSGMVIESNRFNFEPEITAKILKKGIKIHEVPILVHPRGYNEGKKISWKDGFSALKALIKYRFIS